LARYNRAVVLDLVRRFGPLSKSELASRSSLAVSSVLNIVTSLSRSGLVRIVGLGPSTGGRPPVLIELVPGARYALGVNIRITAVEAVLLSLIGDIVAETTLPLQGAGDPESVVTTVVEAVAQVLQLACVDPARVLGAGIGCPGPVKDGRVVVGALSLRRWENVPLAEILERKLGLPVTLENDANLGALAEYRHGAGAGDGHGESLVYVYVDHGIGQGIVIDGKLYRGMDGMAGELGHMVIDVDGPQCRCGAHGCLEALASVGSVIRRTAVAAKLGGATSLADRFAGDWDAVSFAAVSEAASNGDPVARAAIDEAVSYLAVGISNVMRQFRPRMVVLAGELFDQGYRVFDRLTNTLNGRPPFYGSSPSLVLMGLLGPRAPSIGAATLVLETFFGVPEQVMSSAPVRHPLEPAFDQTPVWPDQAEDGILLTRSTIKVLSAGNLQPVFSRIRSREPVTVTVDVLLDGSSREAEHVKALLHWDRVALFGGSWPNPKNSPMHLVSSVGARATFGVTLGSLPPGKYEFAAHVLAADDLWVHPGESTNVNGRIEVLADRSSVSQHLRPDEPLTGQGKEVDLVLDPGPDACEEAHSGSLITAGRSKGESRAGGQQS